MTIISILYLSILRDKSMQNLKMLNIECVKSLFKCFCSFVWRFGLLIYGYYHSYAYLGVLEGVLLIKLSPGRFSPKIIITNDNLGGSSMTGIMCFSYVLINTGMWIRFDRMRIRSTKFSECGSRTKITQYF